MQHLDGRCLFFSFLQSDIKLPPAQTYPGAFLFLHLSLSGPIEGLFFPTTASLRGEENKSDTAQNPSKRVYPIARKEKSPAAWSFCTACVDIYNIYTGGKKKATLFFSCNRITLFFFLVIRLQKRKGSLFFRKIVVHLIKAPSGGCSRILMHRIPKGGVMKAEGAGKSFPRMQGMQSIPRKKRVWFFYYKLTL
jgi:hypothetical protein